MFEDFAFGFHIAVWRIVPGVCLWFSYHDWAERLRSLVLVFISRFVGVFGYRSLVFISRFGGVFEDFALVFISRFVGVFGYCSLVFISRFGGVFEDFALVFISWFGGVFEEFAFGFHISIWRSI